VKPASPALAALLAGWNTATNITMADLFTFTLAGGEVIRLTGAQTALAVPAALFPAGSVNAGASGMLDFALGPRFTRTKTKTDIGVQVSELDLQIYAGGADLIGTVTWQQAARTGLFDGATLEVDRAFMQPYGTVAGTVILFYGHTGEISIGRTALEMKAVDMKDLLTIQMPRRLYQSACNHIFGDAMCGFNRASLAFGGTAVAGTTQSQVALGGLAPSPATLYIQGTITGVGGQNAGYTRTINNAVGNTVYVLKAWLFPVALGDAFTLLPGCDHTSATCAGTFDNLARFGGFPYIPPPEDAV
jgi:uncharacterized phage protein (TIGR02218 family)